MHLIIALSHVPSTVQDSIQDEADEVAEILGVEGAAWCSAHVVADGQWDLPHLRVAVVTVDKDHTCMINKAYTQLCQQIR